MSSTTLFLHDTGIIDTSPLGENENGQSFRIFNVFFQSLGHQQTVFGLGTFKPNLRRGLKKVFRIMEIKGSIGSLRLFIVALDMLF